MVDAVRYAAANAPYKLQTRLGRSPSLVSHPKSINQPLQVKRTHRYNAIAPHP